MALTVVLIRHAKPEMMIETTDFMRPLSAEGKLVQQKMCQQLQENSIIPTHIFHSPLKRTEETAAIIGTFFNIDPCPLEALGDSFDEENICATLNALSSKATAFLVGHGPSLSSFANRLPKNPCLEGELSRSSAYVLRCPFPIVLGTATFIEYYKP